MTAPLYCVCVIGDSTTSMSISYAYQYFGLSAAQVPDNEFDPVNGERPHFRYFRSSPKMVAANLAESGTRQQNNWMTSPYLARVNGLLPANKAASAAATGRPRFYIASILLGTNGDENATIQAANLASYAGTLKAAGWDAVIAGTIWSRTDQVDYDTTFGQPYNAIIRGTGWAAGHNIDGIFDLASDSRLGAVGAADNTTYFSDKVHPTQAGQAIASPIWGATLDAVAAGLG